MRSFHYKGVGWNGFHHWESKRKDTKVFNYGMTNEHTPDIFITVSVDFYGRE